jgi:TonB family protein
MRFSKTFLLALIISVGWHISWGLLFNLSLGKEFSIQGKIIPIYYVGKNLSSNGQILNTRGTVSSVLPPFALPEISLIQPPMPSENLPETEKEILSKRVKYIETHRTEPSLKESIKAKFKRIPLSSWSLPEGTPENKEIFIQWEDEQRNPIHSHFPPYPEWAEEAEIRTSVTLKFWVSRKGKVKKVIVEKSSGEARLDILASNYLRRWEFSPSVENDISTGLITMNFSSLMPSEVRRKNE